MSSTFARSDRVVSEAMLAALRTRVHGPIVCPDDADYAEVSKIWNRAAQRRPAVIVRCTRSADVVAAIDFARSADLPIAVRGGGHSPAGMSSCHGVVIDTRMMRSVSVDPLGRVALVAAGATWGAVDAATQRYGYAIPGVPVSGIGVAGSTLTGGFGLLRRAYGLACDNLIGADLVTAEGSLITTTGDMHPELLWGLRGGGGNFGVVTALRFRILPLPELVLSGPVVYPAAQATTVLHFYREYTACLREDVTTRLVMLSEPIFPRVARNLGPLPSVPLAAISVACVGHPADSARLVKPIRDAAPALADRIGPQSYAALQASPDDAYRPGRFAAVTSCYVDALDDELITALCASHAAMPRGTYEIHVHHMGGAVGRVARMSTAVPNRAAGYLITQLACWDDPADQEASRQWLDTCADRLRRFAVGGPHVGLESSPASSVDTYGAERYLRLAALKRRLDPDNVFTGNQNVVPLA
jgi:FAD/FMN-containing dehydrogenase